MDAIQIYARSGDLPLRDVNPILHAAWKIRDALPQAISIDNFLDSRPDPHIELCGKLAIAKAIVRGIHAGSDAIQAKRSEVEG